jgi:oligosaccharide repeat unit polymerase
VVAVLGLFSWGLIIINLSGVSRNNVDFILHDVGRDLSNYWLSSVVAFSRVAKTPHALSSSYDIDRFFVQTAVSLGAHIKVPNINQKFLAVTPTGETSNTYTIYFSYFKEFGWMGSVLLLAGLGAALTAVWRIAMRGSPVAILFYATFCTAILQTIETETFFIALNGYIKEFIFYAMLYMLLPRIAAVMSSAALYDKAKVV